MRNPNRRRPSPRVLTVGGAKYISPNMIRITFSGPEIAQMQDGCEGAYCKLFLPALGQTRADFTRALEDGPRPDVRTYTVRHMRASQGEMDIDFVEHGDNGPASAWALNAKAGSFCGFAGPNPLKRAEFDADNYIIVADMSALPLAAATLEALPRDATGVAFFEIEHEDDKQIIDAPTGILINWLVSENASCPGSVVVGAVRTLDWPEGRIQTCVAGESSMVKSLRQFLNVEKGLPREDTYISGYWKYGLVEDEHKKFKRSEAIS